MVRAYASVEVEVSDVLEQLEEKDLEEELRRRDSRRVDVGTDTVLLQEIYETFRRRGDAPPCLREYIYRRLGRAL